MDKIEVKVLNPDAVKNSEKMMVCAARLTQRGEKIKNMGDFTELFERGYTGGLVADFVNLPHPAIQKFGVINVVVVGASRRFLAQITRHQNEVKFMSASLQYSDYSGEADFTVPYNIIAKGGSFVREYINKCKLDMCVYEAAVKEGIDNDSAGYITPQGLRNVLIISATPFQWKHMIAQRTCRRNTAEMRYVMLKIWNELLRLSRAMFQNAGPFCTKGVCLEGNMFCKKPFDNITPREIIDNDFPLLKKERTE